MTRIYRYILTHDGGMAPCPDDGLISLGTCKPVIRRMAKPGDWVLGFRPGSLVRGLLLWAGKVEQVMTHGEYQLAHPNRSDAVYQLLSNGKYKRLAPDYHPTQKEMDRDTGAPVLLFAPWHSHYFHGIPEPLPEELAHLAAAGRGHRVTDATPELIAHLESWLGSLGRNGSALPSNTRKARSRGCGPKSGSPRNSTASC